MHIVFNMFGLFIFGREVEDRYGRFEFLRFYLATIVFGGLIWLLTDRASVGAPGVLLVLLAALLAVVLLNMLNNPHREVLLLWDPSNECVGFRIDLSLERCHSEQ